MAEAYTYLYSEENSFRLFIEKVLLMGHEDIETTRIYLHHANQIIVSKMNISHLDKVFLREN